MHFQRCTGPILCVKMTTLQLRLNDVWWDWRTLRFDYAINFESFHSRGSINGFYPIFIQLSGAWTWEDFPHSHVFKSQWVRNCTQRLPLRNRNKLGDYRKSHSVEADKTILIFDGQNMMHWMRTDSLLLCSVFRCIFITIACYLTQIHKKYANLLISFVTMSINNDLQKTEFFHLNNLFVRVFFSAAFCEVR